MNIIEKLEQEELARVSANRAIPDFAPGDTVIVNVNVVEGNRKRVQAYEGVVIGRRNRGLNSSFVVRKVSSGEGVERTFQLYSPVIASIEVKRRGRPVSARSCRTRVPRTRPPPTRLPRSRRRSSRDRPSPGRLARLR